MLDYGRRFLIVIIIAVCIGLLFIGGKTSSAAQPAESWSFPAEGTITDHFGTRNGKHKGVDIAGELHSNIISASDGVVSKSYYSETYGNVVFILLDHEGYETIYAHLSERLVNEGERVKQGQVIGKMGNTGRSTGVHLHFEVHRNNWTVEKENAINPLIAFEGERNVLAEKEVETFEVTRAESKSINHIVKKGETLWGISKQYGVAIELLKDHNNLSSDMIYINQKLRIQSGKTALIPKVISVREP